MGDSDLVCLGWGLAFWIFNKLPSYVSATNLHVTHFYHFLGNINRKTGKFNGVLKFKAQREIKNKNILGPLEFITSTLFRWANYSISQTRQASRHKPKGLQGTLFIPNSDPFKNFWSCVSFRRLLLPKNRNYFSVSGGVSHLSAVDLSNVSWFKRRGTKV